MHSLVPSLHIKRQQTSKQHQDGPPALPEPHSGTKQQDLQARVKRIDTVIKQLAQRTTLMRATGLGAIDRVESLVDEQAGGPGGVDPGRAVEIQARSEVEHREQVGDDEAEARQRDHVGRHAEGEQLNDLVPPVRLEDVARQQRAVDALRGSNQQDGLDPWREEKSVNYPSTCIHSASSAALVGCSP